MRTPDSVNELRQTPVASPRPSRPAGVRRPPRAPPGRPAARAASLRRRTPRGIRPADACGPRGQLRRPPTRRGRSAQGSQANPDGTQSATSPAAARPAPHPAAGRLRARTAPSAVRRSAVTVCARAERPAEIARQRPHVRPLRAAHAQVDRLGPRNAQQLERVDRRHSRASALDGFTGARVVVERAPGALERRIHGRHLRDRTAEARAARARPPPRRRRSASARAVTAPVRVVACRSRRRGGP